MGCERRDKREEYTEKELEVSENEGGRRWNRAKDGKEDKMISR